MKHYRRKNNRRIFRIHKRLDKIETTLQLKGQCILCGFDQGKPDTLFGMKIPKDIFPKLSIMEAKMKFMNTINELQKKLTKLRREVQREEAPKVGDDVFASHNSSVAREAREKFEASLTPDLPLHVRVAKALGHACWTDRSDKWRSHMGRFIPNGVEYPLVPDYPNDLEAAMGALEEYAEKVKNSNRPFRWAINKIVGGYAVTINEWSHSIPIEHDMSLPQAICEAIVAHSEANDG